MDARYVKLAAVGTAAGAFSGLFGVGGGTIIVPLLILWFGYGEREATGTSLAAIVIIAALAAIGQGVYGNVDVAKGIAIGIPAVAGVIAGTALAIEGYTHKEVAEMLGITEVTSRSQFMRARQMLREMVNEEYKIRYEKIS